METNTRQKQEQRLQYIEAQLAASPEIIGLQFERACLLGELGYTEQAKQRYLGILHQDPVHFGALNNFGALLFAGGFWDAALTVYTEAVTHYPGKPVVHVNLANLLFHRNKLTEALEHYEIALQLDHDHSGAHQALSVLYKELGDDAKALHHRKLGYGCQPTRVFPYRGHGEPIPLLLLISATGGDLPWRRLIDDCIFQVTTVVSAFYDSAIPLPPHKIIFNVIGDVDSSLEDLEAAQRSVQNVTVPIINHPSAVLATGRMTNAQSLSNIPGVITPHAKLLSRDSLTGNTVAETLTEHGFRFPLLLRSPGFHMGKYFARVDHPYDLPSALAILPGKELMVIEYLDACGHDGYYRKYRVMMIDGNLYPLHLAISENWKVHYYTAAMAGHAAHQAEEKAFLDDMPKVLGDKALAVLQAIQTKLKLDFGGVDFGLSAAGNILLFEANATMLITPPNDDPQWDYRRAAINGALNAARLMLLKRAELADMNNATASVKISK